MKEQLRHSNPGRSAGRSSPVVSLAAACAIALLLLVGPAGAQTEEAPNEPAAAAAKAPVGKAGAVSVAIERVGGLGYAKVTEAEGEKSSLSLLGIGIGGVTPNPFALPRLGVDFMLASNVTLGGALGFSRLSASSSGSGGSQDIGSVYLYTLTPRIGYRVVLGDKLHLTPRAGVTLMGGSASPGEGSDKAGVFAVALAADAPLAYRLTDSFNLLLGAGLDYTVSAKVSTTESSGAGTQTREEAIKGVLLSAQAWLGLGGYL